ncbi:hypothetical protein HOF78_00210, partial [Candidatus Woesearchaeota archaeon]|nr:hypothetical protein [Candidatus Woesearchaeota archaeon]
MTKKLGKWIITAFVAGASVGVSGTAALMQKFRPPRTQQEAIEAREASEQAESVEPEAPKLNPMDIASVKRTNLNGDKLPDLLIRHNNGMITQYHGEDAATA